MALQAHLLSLMLAFTLDTKSGVMSLSLLVVSTASDHLNDGSEGAYPDNVVLMSPIPTVTTEGTIIQIDPVLGVIDNTL